MKKKVLLMLFGAFVIAFSGCKKGDKGDTGPMGATGAPGNANVSSYTFSVTNSDWILTSLFWYYDYYLPSNVNMDGGVFLYFQSGTTYIALPLTIYDQEMYYIYDTNTKMIETQVRSASGSTAISNPGAGQFKIVVIPPAIARDNPNVDWNNYLEVKTRFNLYD